MKPQRLFVTALAALMLVAAAPSTSAPLADLHYLVGSWNCTYSAGAEHMAYSATYAYDSNGHILRQVSSSPAGGDEELVAYNPKSGWTAIVLDDLGNATTMHARGSDPSHISYRSVYPDAGIAVTFDRISSTRYTLHATVRSGGKTITSADTCVRATTRA
jgi:hypothetical protein